MIRRIRSYGFKLVDTLHVLTSLTKSTKTMMFKFSDVTLPTDFTQSSKLIIASQDAKDKIHFNSWSKLTKSNAPCIYEVNE